MRIQWFQKFSLALTLVLSAGLNALAQQHVSNPFVGATQYVNPDYAAEVQTAIAQAGNATLAAQMGVVATYPTAVWMDHIGAIAGNSGTTGGRLGLAQHLNTALTQQSGTTPIVVTIVIYDLPDRDCAALASNGELSIAANPPTQPLDGLTTYEQDYITPIANILNNPSFANIRFVLVIEPDSLPNLVTNTGLSFNISNCDEAQSSGVYVQGIQFAINTFHAIPNAYLYLDIGHSAWLGWPSNASAGVSLYTTVVSGTTAGLSSVDGFIDDTANYTPLQEPFITGTQTIDGTQVISATFYSFNPTVDEQGYATELQSEFQANGWPPSSTHFITDTSRNGWGGPNRPTAASTSTDVNTYVDASKIDERDHRGQWCNQSNAGLGIPPLAAPPNFPQYQAFVWIKPPGESDGTYPGSANQDGAVHADPNCNPANTNPLAGNTLTGSIANSPPAGQFFIAEFTQLIQNAFPPVPSTTNPSFSISANGTSVEQGASASTSVTVLPVNGFSGSVALSVSGLPTGVTASFSPASITNGEGISALTFTAAANAPVPSAPVTVTITGTSGTITQSTSVSLTIVGRPDFSITAAAPAAVTLTPGQNPTASVTVTALFGFTGTVSISATGLPSGVSANFSPSSVNGSGTIVVNFNAQTSTPSGTTNISIVGTSGNLTHSATIALTVTGTTPDFSLTANPTSVSVAQGASASSTLTVSPLNGFTGSVTLAASGLPTGVTAAFSPASTTGTSTVTFSASSTATAGSVTVTITGTSGSLSHSVAITLTVTSVQPTFSLSANPATLSVAQGASGASTITVTPANGFTGSVALSASGLPAGVTASFSPASTTGTSTLTLAASSTATAGTATVTVTGTSGSLTKTTTIALTVTSTQANFSLSASPASLSITQGATASSTITVTPANGFTGTVSLSASGLPTGVTASFSPASTTGTSTVTFTASSTASGTGTVTVTGTSGSLSHTTTIALTVATAGGTGGVTVTTVVNSNQPFFDDEGVQISNTAAITALSVTITVQNTGGLSFNGQYNTVGSSIVDSHSSTATTITYQYNLSSGQTLSPGTGYLFDAQMSGTGTAHPVTGDTFTVTYTTGGQTFTQSGQF